MKAYFDIDTQIDFIFPAGALYGAGAERVIEPVSRLNRHAAAHHIPLISTMCAHPEDSAEFKVWPPHCVAGTLSQAKPASTLMPRRVTIPNQRVDVDITGAEQIILEKDDLDLFTNPNLEPLLDRLAIDECFVYGVFTEYCVKCAIMGLLKRGRKVSLVSDATAHLSDQAGEAVVNDFLRAGGKCVNLAEAL